jgi:hypothetical protein
VKGYKIFFIVFLCLLTLYIIAEVNKPKPIDWTVTLSKGDKNPYGGFILFNQLKDLFPAAAIQTYRQPVYDQVNNSSDSNTAYVLCSETMGLSDNDVEEMLNYVSEGNYVMLSAFRVSKNLLDTLHVKTDAVYTLVNKDSTYLDFTNPALRANKGYTFRKSMIDDYFSSFDTASSVVLGTNSLHHANFIQMNIGSGKIFMHANPIVFSNYFILHHDNADYTSKVISYLPASVSKIFYDEYYKLGPLGAGSPLRFFLSNEYLRWALRLSLFGMLVYVFFEMKRRQRIIPVITPLRNSTLDFIKTVATVYLQQKDNNSIALKKIAYFLEFIRSRYFLPTTIVDENFIEQLSRKSGVQKDEVNKLFDMVADVQLSPRVSDNQLLMLNHNIDQFYKQVL